MSSDTSRKHKVATIRWRLALLVLACVTPAVLAAIVLIAYDYRQERSEVQARTLARARAVANTLDRQMGSLQSALFALGTSPHLETGNMAGFHAQALHALENIKATNIVLTESSGQQVVNTSVPQGTPLPVAGGPARAKGLFDSGKPVVSDLFTGPVLKQPLFSVVVPIVKNGTVTHGLAAGVSPRSVADLLKEANLPPQWIVAVADSTGTVVARTHEMAQFVGKPVSPTLRQRLLSQAPEGSFEGTTLDGVDVLTSFARSGTTGWSVAIGVPRAGVVQTLWNSVGVAFVVVVIVLLAGFGAARTIGARIQQSIMELFKPAFALGHGQKVEVPPLYFHEADLLGEALTTAADLLQQASSAVDQRDARIAAILESAMDAIITVDEDQRVVLYNRAAADLFGWPREEAIGRPLAQFIPERFRPHHREYVEQFGRQDLTRRRMGMPGEVVGLKRDGEEFLAEASISRIEEDGHKLYTVVLRDITERAKAREALERGNADLRDSPALPPKT